MQEPLCGKTVVVTGGTDGIGKAIAMRVAAQQAQVIIVGSDRDKGVLAERAMRDATGNNRVQFLQADLSLMRETNRLADEIDKRFQNIHRLVLCAGIVRGRRIETAEGLESNFAINYLSRFVLTGRLLSRLQEAGRAGAASRILVIGGAATNGNIHYDDINLTRGFGILSVVSQFCEANDLFVIEQARRLREMGQQSRVTITSLKVGVVRTNIRRGFPLWMKLLVAVFFDPLFGQPPHKIADSALRLLVSPLFEGKSGLLFRQIKRFKAAEPGAHTRAPSEGRRLWQFSEELAARRIS